MRRFDFSFSLSPCFQVDGWNKIRTSTRARSARTAPGRRSRRRRKRRRRTWLQLRRQSRSSAAFGLEPAFSYSVCSCSVALASHGARIMRYPVRRPARRASARACRAFSAWPLPWSGGACARPSSPVQLAFTIGQSMVRWGAGPRKHPQGRMSQRQTKSPYRGPRCAAAHLQDVAAHLPPASVSAILR